jgi:hypothetical protein
MAENALPRLPDPILSGDIMTITKHNYKNGQKKENNQEDHHGRVTYHLPLRNGMRRHPKVEVWGPKLKHWEALFKNSRRDYHQQHHHQHHHLHASHHQSAPHHHQKFELQN